MKIGYKLEKIALKHRLLLWLTFAVLHATFLFLFGNFTDGEPGLYSSVFQGIFVGGIFALVFPFVMKQLVQNSDSQMWKQVYPNLEVGEVMIAEGPATFQAGFGGIGGKLYLTNKRLVFNPHGLNFQKKSMSLFHTEISAVETHKTKKLIQNGININTLDGEQFNLIVNERDVWISYIDQTLKVKKNQESTNSISI